MERADAVMMIAGDFFSGPVRYGIRELNPESANT
jgi:hypothetical protein